MLLGLEDGARSQFIHSNPSSGARGKEKNERSDLPLRGQMQGSRDPGEGGAESPVHQLPPASSLQGEADGLGTATGNILHLIYH